MSKLDKLINQQPTQTEGLSKLDKLIKASVEEPPKQMGSKLDQVLQGATFGFADELGGLGTVIGKSLAGSNDSLVDMYKQGRDSIREGNKNYSNENKWGSLGLQALGALPSGIAGGGKFLLSKAAKNMSNATRNLYMGGSGGAVAGLGTSDAETIAGDVGNAVVGGGLGAAVGVAAPWAIGKTGAGLGYMANAAKNAFSSPATRSNRVIRDYLADAGINNQSQLNEAVKDIDAPLLADASDSMRDLTDAMAQSTGGARDVIKPVLSARQAESGGNIVGALEKTTGKNAGYYESVDKIEEVMKKEAAPLYEKAYATDMPFTDKLQSLFQRKPIESAFSEARKIMEAEGSVVPELFKTDVLGNVSPTGNAPTTEGWDMIKRGLDAMVEKETDVAGKVSQYGKSLISLKNEILKEVDTHNPSYGEARKVWSVGSGVKGAMKKGLSILKQDDYLSAKEFAGMSKADKEGFMLGAMNAIRDKVEMIPQSHDQSLKQIFTAPAMRRRLKNAFPSEDSYNEFMKIVGSEGKKAETNKIIHGSRTNTRGQHQERLNMDAAGNAMGASQGNIFSMFNLARDTLGNMNRMSPEARMEIARALTNPASRPPSGLFLNSTPPEYLQYIFKPEFSKAIEAGSKGILGYGSGSSYSSK